VIHCQDAIAHSIVHYRLAFDRLREMALEPQQSVALITQIANQIN